MTLFRRAANSAICAVVVMAASACTSAYNFPNHLGVLPPQPPAPLWMGAVQPAADSSLRGAAAVTLAAPPHWSHVLVSVRGATPATEYTWRLRSGSCAQNAAVVGPEDRYTPLIPFADGTARAQSLIPVTLTPSSAYSVAITQAGNTAAPSEGCADLTYQAM